MPSAEEKLISYLTPYAKKRTALAFSGGADSTLLLFELSKLCRKEGGSVYAFYASTALNPRLEAKEALNICQSFNVSLEIIEISVLEYIKNNQTLTEVKSVSDFECFHYLKEQCIQFLLDLGLNKDHLRFRDHEQEELSFYSKATSDIEYLYPFGWGELWGIADRTDYDLGRHQEYSKKNLEYLDPETNQKYLPYVIEPSVGADRLFLSVLADAYEEEQLEKETRLVMRFHPAVAPVKVAVLPLTKKQSEKATEVYQLLAKEFNVEYDVAGQIGKRYRRQDAIGTPYCVTVDFDSENDQSVTLRDRDTMEQIRLPIDELVDYIAKKIRF